MTQTLELHNLVSSSVAAQCVRVYALFCGARKARHTQAIALSGALWAGRHHRYARAPPQCQCTTHVLPPCCPSHSVIRT